MRSPTAPCARPSGTTRTSRGSGRSSPSTSTTGGPGTGPGCPRRWWRLPSGSWFITWPSAPRAASRPKKP
ncbi:hypothetical protein RLOC_00001756 [Lonchura striata]|uniref:Uncharacterized protein n=1 Tax=Lonchura striata TaxID=40157 RepID=A0A218U7V1_9PASE|nr:hypothetical protein RLOC_00001756 [Lonchura striata domestica]